MLGSISGIAQLLNYWYVPKYENVVFFFVLKHVCSKEAVDVILANSILSEFFQMIQQKHLIQGICKAQERSHENLNIDTPDSLDQAC